MSERTRRLARLLAFLLVLAATLPPQAAGTGLREIPNLCLVCGARGGADLVLNLLLFVPLGAAVARPGRGWRAVLAALAAGALLSGAVEAAQTLVPGRHPALRDLVANAAGAAGGGLLGVTARAWARPGSRVPDALPAAWGTGAAAVFLATALLMAPSLPAGTWWVQWTPELGQFHRFPGRVLEARAGGLALPPGPLPEAGRRRAARALAAGPALEARVRVEGAPSGLAPALSVFDGRQREVFVLGREGDDLVFRLRRRADAARLHRPEHRAEGLLAGASPGDTLQLRVSGGEHAGGRGLGAGDGTAGTASSATGGSGRRGAPAGEDRAAIDTDGEGTGPGLCLSAGEAVRCGLGSRVGRGWALLVDPGLPPGPSRGLDAVWVALLFLPLGYWAGAGPGWRLGVLAAGGGLVAAPSVGPLLAAGAAEAAGVAAGLAAGVGLQAGIRARSGDGDGGGGG